MRAYPIARFCKFSVFSPGSDKIRIPAKSTLERWEKVFSEEDLRGLVNALVLAVCEPVQAEQETQKLLLEKEISLADLTRAQALQIIKRMDNVIKQLSQALKQAHERIIGERKDKILSLDEDNVHVLVQKKQEPWLSLKISFVRRTSKWPYHRLAAL